MKGKINFLIYLSSVIVLSDQYNDNKLPLPLQI